MPAVFLSPSTQDWNLYVTGGISEEYSMNLIADELIPYLNANAIAYGRNNPDANAADAIRTGNAGNYDFYLALHSNASDPASAGQTRGIIAFYYPGSTNGKRGAELIADELRKIYPLPDLVTTRAVTNLGEVRQPRAPAVLVEIGYHDNVDDVFWIENNRPQIAEALARALTAYFDIPFIEPREPSPARVNVNYGTLNLRTYPAPDGPIIASMPDNSPLTVYGEWQGWYTVQFRGRPGYAAAAYIDLE